MATTTNLGLNKPARTDNINVVTAINNNMDVLDEAIGALPSGSNLQTEISGKADKVASPTNGNFAGLDGNGNLTDSGKKAADFATASEVGTVPSGKTVQGQISDIESDIGTVPSGKTVQGQITDIESSIGTVPSGKTVEGQISEINTTVGSMIDDTSTANNKVWSAQKVNDLKSAIDATLIHDSVSNQSIATFPDGADGLPVEQLIVGIEPVQDLHGQSNPYPGGGGANKLDLEAYIKSRTNDYSVDANGWITINDLSTAGLYANHWAVGPFTNGSCMILVDSSRTTATNVRLRIYDNGSGIETAAKLENKQFDEIGFNWGSNGKATIKVSCVDATTISEWTPYSNICPISGWTGANVSRTGVNVWDEEWEVGGYSTSTGEKGVDQSRIRCKNKILCKPNTLYYNCSPQTVIYLFYDCNENYIDYFSVVSNDDFTTPQNAYYIAFYVASAYGTTYNNDISINYPSTDTQYHAYSGATYSITFPTPPGTVYGGTLTVNKDGTGTLTVDRAIVDLGTLTWVSENQSKTGLFRYDGNPSSTMNAKYGSNNLCSKYKPTPPKGYSIFDDMAIAFSNSESTPFLRIRDTNCSEMTGAQFKASLSGAQFVFELITPVTYNLTNLEVIETLKGMNNVWADTGDIISLDYPADTKLYIAKVIASLS